MKQIQTSRNLPRGRGKAAATLQLEQAIQDVVTERSPITVRGVCYALFTRGLIRDMSTGSTQRVSRVMTEMRELNALDWTRIVDGSRAVERASLWQDTSQIIDAAVRTYRRDNWQDQPALVEVWSEKSTVQGVLAPELQDLGVTFRVLKGFGSFTAVRQAAEDSMDGSKPRVALYLGDWDPSGLFMSEVDLPQRLLRYGSRWSLKRIALIDDDLASLPHFPTDTKSNDARLRWYLGHTPADPTKCWELDAMDPNTLRHRVRRAIEGYMDMDIWQHALAIEAAERGSMQVFHDQWQRRLQGGEHIAESPGLRPVRWRTTWP